LPLALTARALPAALAFAALLLCFVAPVSAAAPGAAPVAVPLPSSALMGLLIMGGAGAMARFPTHKRRRGRRR
jgi:hypothetical protein